MPIRRFPTPKDDGSTVFEHPFPSMLAVKYRGMLVGAAELSADEYIFYMTPDVDTNAAVKYETVTSVALGETILQKLISLTVT